MQLTIDACVGQHQGDRNEQQDRVAIFQHPQADNVLMAVVADGMGGHAGGARAAEQVLVTARNYFDSYRPDSEPVHDMMEQCIMEAHFLINTMRIINEQDPRSTSVSLVLDGKSAYWAHCGDSRLYRFYGRNLIRRTQDHSYVEALIRKGKITLDEATDHPKRNMLLTSIGGEDNPTISLDRSMRLRPGDNYLLCSDGLWAYFTNDELGTVLSVMSARDACASLIERARERSDGKGDNISLAILKLL